MIFHIKLIIFCLVCSFLASCQPAMQTDIPMHTPTLTSIPESTLKITPTDAVIPEFEERAIEGIREEIEASDGLSLVGSYYPPVDVLPPWPGVLLLHILGSERSSWDEYAWILAGEGFAVFALDMRGHGETGGAVNWDLAESDINQVWNHLSAKPDIDPDRLAIIGASIGANLALRAGAINTDVRTVVLLSPGLDYRGVKTEEAMGAYDNRPVLIVASQEDTYSADSSQVLEEIAVGEASLVMYQNAGHGTNMLTAEPELRELIIDWMQTNLE